VAQTNAILRLAQLSAGLSILAGCPSTVVLVGTGGAPAASATTAATASSGAGGSPISSGSSASSASSASSSGAAGCGDTTSDPHNCGACGHDCLGGACASSSCAPILLAMGADSNTIGIAVSGSYVYLADETGPYRVPIGGGPPDWSWWSGGASSLEVTSLAVDATSVYWGGTRVQSVPFTGGTAKTLQTLSVSDYADGLALDATAAYYVDRLPETVVRLDLGTGTASPLGPARNAQSSPLWFSIVGDDTDVYWAANNAGETLWRMPKTGGAAVSLIAGVDSPAGLALDQDTLYWIESGGIYSIPKLGGAPSHLAQEAGDNGSSLAVDATSVYWLNGVAGTLNRVPKGGGPTELLASGQIQCVGVALDTLWVYWVATQQVMKVAK